MSTVVSNQFEWICDFGNKLITNNFETLKNRFPKLGEVPLARQLVLFRNRASEPFNEFATTLAVVYGGSPIEFWGTHIDDYPELAITALAILNINPTEEAVERSFSLQKLVHTPLRNRLDHENVNKEMYFGFNSNALKPADRAPPAAVQEVSIEEDYAFNADEYNARVDAAHKQIEADAKALTINDLTFIDNDSDDDSDYGEVQGESNEVLPPLTATLRSRANALTNANNDDREAPQPLLDRVEQRERVPAVEGAILSLSQSNAPCIFTQDPPASMSSSQSSISSGPMPSGSTSLLERCDDSNERNLKRPNECDDDAAFETGQLNAGQTQRASQRTIIPNKRFKR